MDQSYEGFDPKDAIRLLADLAVDDDLRGRTAENPGEVLAKYRIPLPPDRFPGRIDLPPKRTIAQILEILVDYDVTGQSGVAIIAFVFGHAMPIVEADASR